MPRTFIPPSTGFMQFYSSLTELDIHILKRALDESPKTGDLQRDCIYSLLKDVDSPMAPLHKRGNPRISIPRLPSTSEWNGKKKPIAWIVCIVHEKLPPQDGISRECSHTCLHDDCINIHCLTWETRSANQSRAATGSDGQRICTRKCTHCWKNICLCNNIHNPPCK